MRDAPYRVVIVDDNPIIRAGLAAVLELADDVQIVGEAGDGGRAVELAREVRPDVVLLDVHMPGAGGIAAAAALSEICRVIMVSQSAASEDVLGAIHNGALGYLVHNAFTVDELATAIRDTVRGQAHPLSPGAATVLANAASAGAAPAWADRAP